jgi:hypothetical protein
VELEQQVQLMEEVEAAELVQLVVMELSQAQGLQDLVE